MVAVLKLMEVFFHSSRTGKYAFLSSDSATLKKR